MNPKVLSAALFALLLVTPILASAEPGMTGSEIINRVYNRPDPGNQTSVMTMTLRNKSGSERVRKIKQYSLNMPAMEKNIMFFVSPADVRNTSFMNWSYNDETKSDDQWIYLPALKKIKRISSDSKGDYFMGSDFTYDDLGDRHPSADNHRLVRTIERNGETIFLVESTPKDPDYMYARTESWIVKDKWIGQQKKFYDEDNELLKTLSVDDVRQDKGYWIIFRSTMRNVQNGHSTEIKLEDVVLEGGVSESQFTERMMKRGVR